VPSITRTSELVQDIAESSAEQSAGVAQINNAMTQLNHITQQSASSAEELAATAEELLAQTSALQDLMAFFSITGGNARTTTKGARRGNARPIVTGRPPRQSSPRRDPRGAVDATFERF
jgi:methyl-accepting chemotaxis protein